MSTLLTISDGRILTLYDSKCANPKETMPTEKCVFNYSSGQIVNHQIIFFGWNLYINPWKTSGLENNANEFFNGIISHLLHWHTTGKRTTTETSPVFLQGIFIMKLHAFQTAQLHFMCVWEIHVDITAQIWTLQVNAPCFKIWSIVGLDWTLPTSFKDPVFTKPVKK